MSRTLFRALIPWAVTLMAVLSLAQAAPQTAPGTLPASVLAATRTQIRAYLGNTSLKGIPLLDPGIDWDKQSNWPEQFVFGGAVFKLDIRDLSNNGSGRLGSRVQIRPSMKVSFWYIYSAGAPPRRDSNTISPRATWTPGNRVADKQMMWGGWGNEGAPARDVFAYTFYPAGTLFKFSWVPPAMTPTHCEVYDEAGALRGAQVGTNFFWQGMKVPRHEFWQGSQELYENNGVPASRTSVKRDTSAGIPGRPGAGSYRLPPAGAPRQPPQ